MALESLHLKKEFEIRQLTSLHYFEYKSDFIFKSEYHDYWKLLYVEDGSAEISFSNKKQAPVTLQKGELFIQSPNEYYSFRASSGNIAVLFTAGFYSDTANLSLLANKKLVCIYLEMLLISLMRQYTSSEEKKETPSENTKKDASASLLKTDSILFNRITDYYEAHITEHIKVEHLCKEFGIGRSHLQRIFREQTGYGAIEYFCQMRISAAKRCIRENRMNLTDTAASLGYTSIYYFSKQFKKITGMSPSQYQKMVRSSKKDPLYEQREL